MLDGYVDCSPSAHGVVGLPGRRARVRRGGRARRGRAGPRPRGPRPRGPPHAGRLRRRRRCSMRCWPPVPATTANTSPDRDQSARACTAAGYPEPVVNGVQRALLRVWRHVPRPVRRWVVRLAAPSFTVGARLRGRARRRQRSCSCASTYRDGWGLPGGLIKRREDVADCARREVARGGRPRRRAARRTRCRRRQPAAAHRRRVPGATARRGRSGVGARHARPRSARSAGSPPATCRRCSTRRSRRSWRWRRARSATGRRRRGTGCREPPTPRAVRATGRSSGRRRPRQPASWRADEPHAATSAGVGGSTRQRESASTRRRCCAEQG